MKILIACGGTAGHIFPALALQDALKNRDISGGLNSVLVLTKRTRNTSIIPSECRCFYISLVPLRYKFDLQNLIAVLKLIKGIFESLIILLRSRPDVVVGFGGYASFFPVFFAWLFRIKTIIHEQNVCPGIANKILAHLVDKIAISFSQTQVYLGANSDKAEFTGNPIRQDLKRIDKDKARQWLGLSLDRFTILVMGGSQGSHKINTVFMETIDLIEDKSRVSIIHLCGANDYPFLEETYKNRKFKVRLFSFLKEMSYAYSAADLVISRAGATSISEIMSFGLASIIIPYPYARAHQTENARFLCERNAAIIIEDENLKPEILKERILELANDLERLKKMGEEALRQFRLKADEALADSVLSLK